MEEKKKNRVVRFPFIIIAMIVLATIIYFSLPRLSCKPVSATKVVCRSNLKELAMVWNIYHADKDKQWPINNWCDTLKPYYISKNSLQCPKDKIGPCSYAMNENIPADANELPGDLVLLFESPPGWNQVGGADDVVTDRHDRPGANIAFADGHVEFVDAEDIPNLRWTVEQKP